MAQRRTNGPVLRIWQVVYEVRAIDSTAAFFPMVQPVVASGPDEAYSEAAKELGGGYDLGFPRSATPMQGTARAR